MLMTWINPIVEINKQFINSRIIISVAKKQRVKIFNQVHKQGAQGQVIYIKHRKFLSKSEIRVCKRVKKLTSSVPRGEEEKAKYQKEKDKNQAKGKNLQAEFNLYKLIGEHKFLPRVYSFYENKRWWVFEMEACVGELRDISRFFHFFQSYHTIQILSEYNDNGKITNFSEIVTLEVVFYVATAILLALKHINSKELAHVDVKPENILISREGIPKLIDFGIAQPPSVIKTGSFIGTSGYFAYEFLTAGTELNYSIDCFSLGVTMMEMTYPFLKSYELDWDERVGYKFDYIKRYGLEEINKRVNSWKKEMTYPENKPFSAELKKNLDQALELMVQAKYKERLGPKELLMEEPFKEWAASWAGKGDKVTYFFKNARDHLSTRANRFWDKKIKNWSQAFLAAKFWSSNTSGTENFA
eukprot:maker-scaffold_1-snap-gene-0.8-mRNA-1 protein AED:0.05 eAED:0.08 QI:0/0/0/1/0/0/3/0/413